MKERCAGGSGPVHGRCVGVSGAVGTGAGAGAARAFEFGLPPFGVFDGAFCGVVSVVTGPSSGVGVGVPPACAAVSLEGVVDAGDLVRRASPAEALEEGVEAASGAASAGLCRDGVNRLSILTPDRRAKLTPLSGTAEVVPVANRGGPARLRVAPCATRSEAAWGVPVGPPGQPGRKGGRRRVRSGS